MPFVQPAPEPRIQGTLFQVTAPVEEELLLKAFYWVDLRTEGRQQLLLLIKKIEINKILP